jgi:hypothetical protein
MRREADPPRNVPEHGLASFVAYRERGRSLTYLDMPRFKPPVAERHHVMLGRRADVLFVSVDGVVIHTEPVAVVVNPGEAPAFELAAELFGFGDRAVGTIENVRIRTGAGGRSRPVRPGRFLVDRGTCLVSIRTGYAARGVFTANSPSGILDALPPSRTRCPFD